MELIKQRFTYSIIDLIRDTFPIDINKPATKEVFFDYEADCLPTEKDVFSEFELNQNKIDDVCRQFVDIKLEPNPTNGRKTKYFYNNNQIGRAHV